MSIQYIETMENNGILAGVGGQYVSEAGKTLPPAATAEDREYAVAIDAGHTGKVRIYFRKQKAKRAKHSHWFWLAHRAERV